MHLPNYIPKKPDDDLKFKPALRDPTRGSGLAILWGFITPCFFLGQSFFTKLVTSPRYNFDAKTISFGTSCTSSFLVLILGVTWYWRSVSGFDRKLFLIGFAGSIFDTIGKTFIQTAFSRGPAGPVAAFVEINNVLLVCAEALRTWTMPSGLEFFGFIGGITGGLSFIFPKELQMFKRFLLCVICC